MACSFHHLHPHQLIYYTTTLKVKIKSLRLITYTNNKLIDVNSYTQRQRSFSMSKVYTIIVTHILMYMILYSCIEWSVIVKKDRRSLYHSHDQNISVQYSDRVIATCIYINTIYYICLKFEHRFAIVQSLCTGQLDTYIFYSYCIWIIVTQELFVWKYFEIYSQN